MKRFNLKIRNMALIAILTGIPIATALNAAEMPSGPAIQQLSEEQCLQHFTDRIMAISRTAESAFSAFTDKNNQEAYFVHVNRFANIIHIVENDIINPIDARLATATGTFKQALVISKDIVHDMLNHLRSFHTVLVKHLTLTNAINFKNDLEPVIATITSQATFQKASSKLNELESVLKSLSYTVFANKIAEVRAALTSAHQKYEANKDQDRKQAFVVLMQRLKKKQ